jgi:hypothetical protein
MEANNFLVKAGQGKTTLLDKAYQKHIETILQTSDDEKVLRWETYNIVIQELVKQGKVDYFNEIKYRLTDGEEPSFVILDIIDREIDDIDGLIWFLKRRIEEYIEDDKIRRFYE